MVDVQYKPFYFTLLLKPTIFLHVRDVMSLCADMCRQRINANGFNAIWFILLKQTQHYFNSDNITCNHTTINAFLKILICMRWSFFITPDSSFLLLPSPCCLLPCWELTAYLLCSLGGLALPHPSPLSWPHFPQVPGNALHSCRAHYMQQIHFLYTSSSLSELHLASFFTSFSDLTSKTCSIITKYCETVCYFVFALDWCAVAGIIYSNVKEPKC